MFLYLDRVLKIFLIAMIIDSIWLVTMNQRFYKQHIGYLFGETVQYGWAILFYILYAIAVHHFVIMPYMDKSEISFMAIFIQGFFFGFVVYSAYDLTNQATIKNWPFIVTVVDMLWGGVS